MYKIEGRRSAELEPTPYNTVYIRDTYQRYMSCYDASTWHKWQLKIVRSTITHDDRTRRILWRPSAVSLTDPLFQSHNQDKIMRFTTFGTRRAGRPSCQTGDRLRSCNLGKIENCLPNSRLAVWEAVKFMNNAFTYASPLPCPSPSPVRYRMSRIQARIR